MHLIITSLTTVEGIKLNTLQFFICSRRFCVLIDGVLRDLKTTEGHFLLLLPVHRERIKNKASVYCNS